MTKHILLRLGAIIAIILITTLVFFLLSTEPAAGMGPLFYSLFTGFVLAILYAVYLCMESINLFRGGKTGRGVINIALALVLLTTSLYFMDYYYFINIF